MRAENDPRSRHFAVVDDNTIHVTAPAGAAAGPVDVVVTDPAGDSDPLTYTYTPVTTITGVGPTTGPEAGGTTVTIQGSCFTGATAVRFGTVTVTDFTVNPAGTVITVQSPAGSGTVDVTVVGGSTCGTATDPDAFSYVAAASAATGITPAEGPTTGSTKVTITGTGFTGATGVTFAGIPGTHFTVVDDSTITVDSPAHAIGTVDVVVVDPAGVSAPLPYRYIPESGGSGSSPGDGSSPSSGGASSPLAFTGVDATAGIGLAVMLLLIGATILAIRIRRTRH